MLSTLQVQFYDGSSYSIQIYSLTVRGIDSVDLLYLSFAAAFWLGIARLYLYYVYIYML
jgi:hypothetical protein